ncbi:DNA polymerase I [Lentimicrobium sp.]
MSSSEKKLFLLDAMALIYRAYYALNRNPRITSTGLNTSAILGFANSLYDVIKNEKPSHIGVAFDTRAPTVRHEEFAEYKATRETMPEDIATAIPYIMKLIKGFNIPILLMDGYEADDIIGTLAHKAAQAGFTVYMMTPDKDFGQLVTEKIFQYKPGKPNEQPVIMGVKEVCEKFGVSRPTQVIDILGLWGDTSDNIPGIPGVGEVTARKLIQEFDSVENLIENAHKIEKESLRKKVIEHSEQALLSRQLATIILDVPIAFDPDALKMGNPDIPALKALFAEIEFVTFANRVFADLEKDASKSTQPNLFEAAAQTLELSDNMDNIGQVKHNYYLVDTVEARKKLIEHLSASYMFCFDTETTGLDANNVELVGLSFATKPGEAWFVPIPPKYDEALKIVQEFAEVFGNEKIEKTGQNLKYDISVLKWYETEVNGPLFDTMIAHYLIEPDQRHSMDFLARTYLRYDPVPIEELIGKRGKNQLSMRVVAMEQLKEYACEDADITLQLRNVLEPMLQDTNTRELFDEIEMPLVKVLAAMEAEGVKIDSNNLNQYSQELQQEIHAVEQQIFTLCGVEFNIASPKQLGEVLFDRLQLSEKTKKTKTKQHSTSEDVLQKLIHKHPVVELILEYRSLTKLKSTYVDALPLLVNPRTGRIHTSYNQAVAATGRLSSNNPNLQNIPIRTERGREIRKAFVPRNDNYTLLSADYSQIELRIIAHISGDEAMQQAFRDGLDIHEATAARIYNIALDSVSKEMRRNAKTVNFGIIYGISAFGLSERLGIPRREAADIIQQYFERFTGIKKYMDDTILFAKENGYVETLMKRRRYLRDINSANAIVRGFAERNAINAPIQGSSADMIKIAMINIQREFQHLKLRSRMIMQVHDELVFDVHLGEVEVVKELVDKFMKNAIQLEVPLVVEMSTGNNWLEAH